MSQSPLPYLDSKSVGAADFYFAINATFRFVLDTYGIDGLRGYWTNLGTDYFAPVSARWKEGGLPAVAAYWKSFYAAEPGAVVDIELEQERVTVQVNKCPAINFLREHRREIVPCFCQHCYFISHAIAAPAGMAVRIHGGNGECRQAFFLRSSELPPQDLARIKEATC